MSIAEQLTGRRPSPRRADLCTFKDADGGAIDQGLVLFFPGPSSYTGEDVVELQGHGGPVVVDWLLERILSCGARSAEPGEFTLRAFLNDKIDLTQAEAVAALIESGTRQAAQASIRSLTGRFSERVDALQNSLTEARVRCEAWLDFPDDEIDPASLGDLECCLDAAESRLDELISGATQGAALHDGLSVAIAGPPNAGKSSLLNRLAGRDIAIVTDIPGTTRDALSERLDIGGLPVTVVDTAGLRASDDPVEREGVRRARAELERADHVLWVAEIQRGRAAALAEAEAALGSGVPYSIVLNKLDLTGGEPRQASERGVELIELSALTAAGLPILAGHLRQLAGVSGELHGTFSARRRHLDALRRGRAHLLEARRHFGGEFELAAEELRGAQTALSELTGELTSDDLLGAIFASFCIGK